MRHSRSLRRRFALLVTVVLLPLASCLDGPFAHANPHDGDTEITLTIVGGTDTLHAAGDRVLFQLVTTPVTSGYTVAWSSSNAARLSSVGFGAFQVGSLPATATTVQVRAALGDHVATRDIVIDPAP